ncbi:MAG: hypothetical protein HC927_10790, partial [Deltaproteobacteria bacterium]|nr:hypothetical protein [Deltaproteobacteria bacterium]
MVSPTPSPTQRLEPEQMSFAIDPELVEEFLTESGELIEQLDADLVILESEPGSSALLDQIFRALHTIKGAASFLNLAELVEFAHAAEDALNKLRKGERKVDQGVIDAMLQSVDVLRTQLAQVAERSPITPGPAPLIEKLHAIASTDAPSKSTHPQARQPPVPLPHNPAPTMPSAPTARPAHRSISARRSTTSCPSWSM